jgi:hypothetical protein
MPLWSFLKTGAFLRAFAVGFSFEVPSNGMHIETINKPIKFGTGNFIARENSTPPS